MTYFVLSLLALITAPPLYLVMQTMGRRVVVAERVFMLVITGLVVGHIFPESFVAAGWWAVVAVAIGVLLPTLLERTLHHHGLHMVMIAVVTIGLALHGLMDGAALGLSYQMGADLAASLPLAVVLHRIPAALFLWWVLRPQYGLGLGWGALLLLGVTTCLGFWFATADVIALRDKMTLGIFQALVGGSLIHLAVHNPENHDQSDH